MFAIGAAVIIANWPVSTRYGVNLQWFSKRIPLYEKAVNFLSRDLQIRRLAREISGTATDDQEKLLKIFAWVTEHIQPTPPGFPIVDDHVWNIFVRGYGATDQRAEAFAILVSYAGLPAAAIALSAPDIRGGVNLTIAQSQGRLLVFDAPNKVVFRNEQGRLASIDDLLRNPALITSAAERRVNKGIPYEPHFALLREAHFRFFRMENQKPWHRVKSELMRLVGGDHAG